jgi:hypothetical protein
MESYAPTRLLGEQAAPGSGQDAARSRRATLNTAHTTASGDSINDARFVSGTVLAGRYRIVGLLGRGGMMLTVYSGLLSFFVFFLLRLVLRKAWLGAGVFWLLVTVSYALRGGAVPPGVLLLDLAAGGLLALALILMLTRFGLLSVIAAQFFIHLSTSYPLTTDLTAWYADSGLLALAIALAFAVYGFHTSLAGRPLFRGRLLEE